jgi:beta-1,4-N-acetylglucosaminyltransferase
MIKNKIFVTSGSSLGFDDLIKIIDFINKDKKYIIIVQIGKGNYIPKNCDYFKFTDNMNKFYNWCDLLISHTGGTTLSEFCKKKKPLIAISNPKGYKDISDVAEKLSDENYLLYIPFDLIKNNSLYLDKKIKKCLNKNFKIYNSGKNTIAKEILNYLNLK